MSIFYCEFHGCLEDSDEVGFNEARDGETICDVAIDLLDEDKDDSWNPYYPDNPYWEGGRRTEPC